MGKLVKGSSQLTLDNHYPFTYITYKNYATYSGSQESLRHLSLLVIPLFDFKLRFSFVCMNVLLQPVLRGHLEKGHYTISIASPIEE